MEDKSWIEIDVLTSEITGKICAERCGSRCCNVVNSEHYIPIEIVDYENLSRIGVEHFVTFYSTVERPQLLNVPDGNCVFLDPRNKLCSIYEFRPLACRQYPYRSAVEDESDVPEWCELLHRSSAQLQLDRITQNKRLEETYEMNVEIVERDVLMEYLNKDRGFKPFELPNYLHQTRFSDQTESWSLSGDSAEIVEQLRRIIKQVRNQLPAEDWIILKLLVYNDDLQIEGIIEGLVRATSSISIEYIDNFPPAQEEFERLMNLVSSTEELKHHLYGGTYLNSTVYDKLRDRCKTTDPINSEFQ